MEETPYISDFIRMVMPQASAAEQLAAQGNLDRFLAVIDEIHARITRERSNSNPQDNSDGDGRVNSLEG